MTFSPKGVITDGLEPVRLGSTIYHLFTRSYSNYGLDTAQQLVWSHGQDILEAHGGHPCYLRNSPALGEITGLGDHAKCWDMLDVMFAQKDHHFPSKLQFQGEKFYAIENVMSLTRLAVDVEMKLSI